MGITSSVLRIIADLMPRDRVLSLAYPDIVVSHGEFADITGVLVTESNRFKGGAFPETVAAFKAMGAKEFRAVDIAILRDVEDIVNLNYPQSLGEYDLVLDCGTTEHCADIWTATLNAANAVAVGGYVIHTPPLTMTNHGFYCVQPTFYYDLYTQNGWHVHRIDITDGKERRAVNPHARVHVAPELVMICVAQRESAAPLKYPTQAKYAEMLSAGKR